MGCIYFTKVYKNNIPDNLAMAGWCTTDDSINIYKIDNECKTTSKVFCSIIRFGTDSQGNTYFWNGEVYHKIVSQALNLPWIVAYVYGPGESKLLLSRSYKIEAEEFRKYLENDEIIRGSIKDIVSIYPEICSIDVNGSLIDLPL